MYNLWLQAHIVNMLRSANIAMTDEDHYMSTLLQTECERVKFLIRSYVRTRLHKVRPSFPPSHPTQHSNF